MKIAFLLCSFFLAFFSNKLYAQSDFAPVGAKWYYSFEHESGAKGYYLQEVLKDTLYKGQHSKKITRSKIFHQPPNPKDIIDTLILIDEYIYSTPDTVFYYNYDLSRFLPLYIFNVNAGDTMVYHVPYLSPGMPPEDTTFRLLVTNVTYSIIDGRSLKTIHHEALDDWGFDGLDTTSYTEKIGHENGLISHSGGTHLGNYFPSAIRCYFDDELQYLRDTSVQCDYIDGITNIKHVLFERDQVFISPNPASDFLLIGMVSNEHIEQLEMYNIAGIKVAVLLEELNNHQKRINISTINKGIYFIRINTKEHVYVRKIIIY